MIRLAFSTIACPSWTLERVASAAYESGFEGVELRTFGPGSGRLACDPALTDPRKTVDLFAAPGVDIAGLGSSGRFDEPIRPPVLGRVIGDYEKPVRAVKHDVDLAEDLGAEYVRVFAFEPAPGERPGRALGRIVDRLKLACDHARHRGVRLALENGGGYARAEQIAEIIDRVNNPLLDACYNLAAGAAGGDSATDAVRMFGDRLLVGRLKDICQNMPERVGRGDLPCRDFVSEFAGKARDGAWLVFEWDKLWLPQLADPEHVLGETAKHLIEWITGATDRTLTAA